MENTLVWPCSYTEGELSKGLREIHRKSLSDQVEYWRKLANDLRPEGVDGKRMHLPCVITSDFLGRYFDSTQLGSSSVYDDTTAQYPVVTDHVEKMPRQRSGSDANASSAGDDDEASLRKAHSGRSRISLTPFSESMDVIKKLQAMKRGNDVRKEVRAMKQEADNRKLGLKGFIYVLGTHYGLVPIEASLGILNDDKFIQSGSEFPNLPRSTCKRQYAALEGLWNVAQTDGYYVTKASFDYMVRRMRLGFLLATCQIDCNSDDFGSIFNYDYTKSMLRGSMTSSMKGMHHWSWFDDEKFDLDREQVPVASEYDEEYANVEEFLFQTPTARGGHVHWVHLHSPSNALMLMLGQMYSFGIHCLTALCRLTVATPQYHHTREWKFMTFPAVHLDHKAKETLKNYREWKRSDEQSQDPPDVFVGTIIRNIAFVWHDDPKTPEEETRLHSVVTATSDATYLGSWSTSASPGSWWSGGCPCGKRKKRQKEVHNENAQDTQDAKSPRETSLFDSTKSKLRLKSEIGRKKSPVLEGVSTGNFMPSKNDVTSGVAASSQDLEAGDLDEMCAATSPRLYSTALTKAKMKDRAISSTEFDSSFKGILLQLGKDYSVLRMGNHRQLVYRILLDRAVRYMDAIRLYSGAISVLQHLLKREDSPNKDVLIDKITHAKLQLATLVRMIEPFIENCLPGLIAEGHRAQMLLHKESSKEESPGKHVEADADRLVWESASLSVRVCRTHLIDIEHNLKSFLNTARTQMQLCELSIAQYDRDAADKSNAILNFLTIITFLIMPVQIVTGWYGMNWKVMPELHWQYGYYFCMLLGVGGTGLASLLLVIMRAYMS